MKTRLIASSPDSEYYFEEGCFITELSNSNEDPAVSIAQARVLPGETTRWHKLIDTVERYVIVSGVGTLEVGDLPATKVGAGDTVVIAAGDRQRIYNHGEMDLVFLAICSPRFQTGNYVDLESTD